MGLFNKNKDDGWDEDAALEFHNKAPAAKVSDMPASKVGNLHRTSSVPEKPVAEPDVSPQPEIASPSPEEANDPDNEPTGVFTTQQAAKREVAPASAEAGKESEPQDDTPMELGEEMVEENPPENPPDEGRVTLMPVISMKSSVSEIGELVQSLKADVEKLKVEREHLEDHLGTLRADIDVLEATTPEFDSKLREMVDTLNEEITREFVAGVEPVEIPQYEAANELAGVIEKVAELYAERLPALEKSRDSASSMLETLVPDSNMYTPTKDLVDFSTIAVEKIFDFFVQKTTLKKDYEKALESYDILSETFKNSKARSDANLKKVNTLAETIHNFTDEFQQLGNSIEDIRWSSFESE